MNRDAAQAGVRSGRGTERPRCAKAEEKAVRHGENAGSAPHRLGRPRVPSRLEELARRRVDVLRRGLSTPRPSAQASSSSPLANAAAVAGQGLGWMD
jgi:hypothetical protein